MPVVGQVPWSKAAHTDAKHKIYRAYLAKWYPILLSDNGYPSVTYAEGFAGPGVYEDGSPGSPVIAIQALLDTPELEGTKKTTRFVFVDNDPRCVKLLGEQLRTKFPTRPRPPDLMPVSVVEGSCAEAFEPALEAVGAWHQPILAVFDSWGNAPVPYRLIRRLAQNPSSEVVVTFMPQHFIRFVDKLGAEVDVIFGHDSSWRDVAKIQDGSKKKTFLLGKYRKMLREAGFQFILDFELVTKKGESLYLIFGSNHRRGLEKMKQSVWEVDALNGVGFRDPKDEFEEPLFDLNDPHLAPLERMLIERLSSGDSVRVEALREFSLFSTVYREQHVIPALIILRDRNLISCDRPRIERAALVRLA
ncbi:three-Cys-motif partner protein [Rhodococcus erythropolis]|uniref:three-Cys-motif partner protein TcmP n=1 Tax=Rhodococcus erythropolis TaxID=1833 RepID=UPI00216A4BC2|nr:three-Cys-motif partner protein TcmP [Rhodococcus erythropolis]MCS4255954.1 three-Cys-motif partner protein [Rhodococcus erythropolis]MCW2425471.1 three-Cys-motif partner protein [Rhodococcus erythropolis]